MSTSVLPANPLLRFANWLHLQWPAGIPERLPVVAADAGTTVPGLLIVGDLTGVPLLKFALDTGAKAAQRCIRELGTPGADHAIFDVVIIGGGVAGMAAALELAGSSLRFCILESNQRLATIANFPFGKPIFTYPSAMVPTGRLQVGAGVKEELLAELESQFSGRDLPLQQVNATHVEKRGDHLAVMLAEGQPLLARRVIVAIGRSGNFRKLGVPGEDLPQVVNRLHDPKHYTGQAVTVVGGGDSACEAAIACAAAGARVTLVHRGADLAKAKAENAKQVMALATQGTLQVRFGAKLTGITATATMLANGESFASDGVLALIGREAPLDFFRRSGVPIRGERSYPVLLGLAIFFVAITLLYTMKAFGLFAQATWNPAQLAHQHLLSLQAAGAAKGFWYTITASASNGIGFFISVLYCTAVVSFGIDRMRRRRTPYVRLQTLCLMAVQCIPLFLLPEVVLPWLGHLGAWDGGWLKSVADSLFPAVDYDANGREYWRAYGFLLAWPLFVWNVFTSQPLTGWLIISLVQTFAIIPLIVWRWGKGAYCGWLCSCGALAETMGDRHRTKMPHGPLSNRFNFIGQIVLAVALMMLALRVLAWVTGWGWATNAGQQALVHGWKPVVDFFLAGALGTGLYFAWSGRVWCRFACPLAALMHIYARFSRFRILVDSKKCISCNACTTTCHQGIDIMQFANRGLHMEDPQCVRCSACVQACPTDVLSFGRVDGKGEISGRDAISARVAEST
jgi:NosR/NirI family nitrous oxide reductase transcriptional regulator